MRTKSSYWVVLGSNIKKPALFIAGTSLFIIYWLLFPDNSSAQAIRVVLWAWAALTIVVLVGNFIYWKWKI